jgi:hypothetical protein
MPCQIVLEGIEASPPYLLGNQPVTMTVTARCTADCTNARVIVRAAGPGSPALVDQVVVVQFPQPSGSPGPLPGLILLAFLPPSQLGLICGDYLRVEVTCEDDPSCLAAAMARVTCKPEPPGTPPPRDDPENPDPGGPDPHPHWPHWRCLFTAAAAAMALLAGLFNFALGVATQNGVLIDAGGLLLGVAAAAWALWDYWCDPDVCTRVGVLCWVFKRAFLAALPMIPFSTNMVILLVIIAYGSIAGLLVQWLQKRHCFVPAARGPLTQFPI